MQYLIRMFHPLTINFNNNKRARLVRFLLKNKSNNSNFKINSNKKIPTISSNRDSHLLKVINLLTSKIISRSNFKQACNNNPKDKDKDKLV